MRKKLICFALSAMLVLTLIPQISFAAEEAADVTVDETVATEEPVAEPSETESEETLPETDETGVITGFVPLETSEYYYEGNPEEGELTVNLPETLSVYLNGSNTPRDIAVFWEAVEDFDNTDFYFYSMKPVWDSELVLSDTLSPMFDVPWITVYKQEPENDSVEPVVTEEETAPLYTEEEGCIDPEEAVPENTSDLSLKALASDVVDGITEDAYADTATNTAVIYNYLTRTLGLNTAAACGVMININAESAMSPINLQNTYNTKFGLSDEAYTDAVNKGKGVYKTSSGKEQNFKSDSGGYGLCQWTSTGRKTNLLNRAVSSNRSIGDINMQLEHLNVELQSYQQVLTTLRSVPNNAAGAYIAAAEFCLAYEIPANTVSTAASRGKTCLTSYWQKYSGSAASATGTSFVSLCGYAYPTAIKVGKGMDVTGYVVSNYNVTSVTATISNSSGTSLYTKTLKPNTTAYKLSNLDDYMKFAKLSAGTYTYTITATDALGKSVTASHRFTAAAGNTPAKALGFTTTGAQPAAPAVQNSAANVKKAYSGTFPKLPKRGYFKKGDKGTQVKNLQKFLKWYGYSIKVDGKYGKNTVKTVKKFQKAMKIKQDGKFGKKTLAKAKEVKK
ncbi:MAG: peptidoglycan-binding protein [Clostridia bacterium]|nr:peptidoglycan-binding protein [Clostridia bacterium]